MFQRGWKIFRKNKKIKNKTKKKDTRSVCLHPALCLDFIHNLVWCCLHTDALMMILLCTDAWRQSCSNRNFWRAVAQMWSERYKEEEQKHKHKQIWHLLSCLCVDLFSKYIIIHRSSTITMFAWRWNRPGTGSELSAASHWINCLTTTWMQSTYSIGIFMIYASLCTARMVHRFYIHRE